MDYSDEITISKMHENSILENAIKFKKVTYKYINDINQGNYQSGISFDTSSAKNDITDLSKAFIEIPFSIAPTTSAFSASTLIAPKVSLLSLIYGITVQSNSTSLVSETDGSCYIRNLMSPHLFTNMDENDLESIMYGGPDNSVQISPFTKHPTALPTLNSNSTAANVNSSLSVRTQMMKRLFNASTGKFEGVARLPLAMIHPFFQSSSFLQLNNPLQITLLLSGTGNNFQPFVYGSDSDVSVAYTLAYGNVLGATPKDGQNMSTCRFGYTKYDLLPADANTFSNLLAKDSLKMIQYKTSQRSNILGIASGTGTLSSVPITNSVIYPLELWILCLPANSLSSVTSLSAPSAARFSSFNVMLNNEPVFSQNVFDRELYNQLQSMYPESQIKWHNFCQGGYHVCIDLTRLPIADKNSSQNLQLSTSYTASATWDLFFIVNRLVTLQLKQGSGSYESIIKSGV